MTKVNYDGITTSNWMHITPVEVAPGIFERKIWGGDSGQRATVLEFKPEAQYPGIDVHLSGPEQLYVISGVFNDGKHDYNEGTFINNPVGSAHIPQSKTGCMVLVLFPEG